MEEIENIQSKLKPQKKGRAKGVIMFCILAGLGGVAAWQWPWLQPRLVRARAAVVNADFNFWSKARPGEGESADGSTSAQQANGTVTNSDAAGELPRNVADSVFVPAINSRPVPVDAGEQADTDASAEPDVLLNHRRYEVADVESLVPLNAASEIRLKAEAQSAIAQMIAKAKVEGVQLGIISGFRTLADQDYLYFDLKAERGQSAKTRAEVSAPPGYSEHHTGYAVDFIDEGRSETHLDESFETTPAFKWLEKNAPYFNFEMSFPKGNTANVSYEPWHWRYVGNQESLELFYK